MKVKSVETKSLAERYSILPGDEILEVNIHPIRDLIDYKFHSSEEKLHLKIKGESGRIRKVKIIKKPDQDIGITFEEKGYRSCGNKCIFCFVDQLPKGLRKPLYFKDEDYRLSFLQGNFITLTNLSEQDFRRITTQRLSPLYISVHTTDESLRKKMLGNPKIPDIIPLIRRLAENRIQMHTQIVLCPGINNGKFLESSVKALSSFYPRVKSLAIVPVGLTRHRKGLPKLKPVHKEYAGKIVGLIENLQSQFRKKIKSNFVYAADEFYLLAGLDIPSEKYYDDFYQIENGVGLVRKLLDDFKSKERLLPPRLKRRFSLTLVTGELAKKFMSDYIIARLKKIKNLKINLVEVKNNFLGESVTISGLLSGRDILGSLKKCEIGDLIILPPNCINEDGLFLDDLKPFDLGKELGRKIVIGSYDLAESLLKVLPKEKSGA